LCSFASAERRVLGADASAVARRFAGWGLLLDMIWGRVDMNYHFACVVVSLGGKREIERERALC